MLQLTVLAFSVLLAWGSAYAQTENDAEEAKEEIREDSHGLEALDFTQREKQERFDTGIALNIGSVMPWAELGASFLWRQTLPIGSLPAIGSLSLGAGQFEFSDNYRERNYQVDVRSKSAYYALRIFPLSFGPLYIEPMLGLVQWNGDIRSFGEDPLIDELASALSSRFDSRGLSVGANLGLMWIFSNRIFIDYNLLGITKSYFLNEYYSTNTGEARAEVRRQIQGPLSMSNAHLRVGWSWNI